MKSLHPIISSILAIAALLPVWMPRAAQAQVVDRSTMTNKVMAGYQGWFACPGDGNDPAMGWTHWAGGGNIGPGDYHCDIWPDTAEYDSSDLFFVPNTVLTQGGTPYLFSPYRQGAVDVHFRWMQEYGIDGAFLQRFISECGDPTRPHQKHRDRVLQNVMNASATFGRTFAVEYDISGGNNATLYNDLVNDWTYLKNTFNVKNHSRYLHHAGKPVVVIWGFGFGDRPGTPALAQQVLDWFKADGCFVIAGVPRDWRTNSTWINTYRNFNGITPWTVGSYRTWTDISNYRNNTVVYDLAECNSRGILYMPTAWPRFQWDNMNDLPCGTSHFSPRDGQHLWDQVYAYKNAGAQCQFIAMFDEYDEGTAIMKCTDNVPVTDCWMTTDGKGNDWFLRLTNQAGRMYRGEIGTARTPLPIGSATIPDNAQIVSDTIPNVMQAGQQYPVSVTIRNTGETYWNPQTFKLGAVGDYDPMYSGNRVEIDPPGMLAPNQQVTFSFTLTAPASSGTYITDWEMVHEKIRWFGAILSKQVEVDGEASPPGPVTAFVTSIADRTVTLNWNNPTDADFTGTMIRFRTTGYPSGPSDGSLVCNRVTSPGSADSYTHSGLTNGVRYYYAAYAYDGAGTYSVAATATAVPEDITGPASAQNFRATGADGYIALNWINPTDDDFVGMRILAKTTGFPISPTDGSIIYSGTGTSHDHTVANGVTYYYAAYALDGVPNYSTVSRGSASAAVGACAFESFPYPNGGLSGNNGWAGAANNQIEVVNQTIKITGAETNWEVTRSVSCSPVGGVIWLRAQVRSGIGVATMWGLWIDDTSGANLARWYGTGTTARGRIGGTSFVTAAKTLTGGWDTIAAKIDVLSDTSEFFFNGESLGILNHSPAGNSIGRVKIERIGYGPATGHYMYLDNLLVGQVDAAAPSPVGSFTVIVGDQRNDLKWTNPTDPDFAGTVIRFRTNTYPSGPTDGIALYTGTGSSFAHTGRTNGMTYYYSAFAFDGVPNYSVRADASGTPLYFDPYDAKLLPHGTDMTLTAGVVTAAFTNRFYAQSSGRRVGIRVDRPGHGLSAGQAVRAVGTVLVDPLNDEKFISATWSEGGATAAVPVVAMNSLAVGGPDWNYDPVNKSGQRGIAGAAGVNNIGMLVKVWGKVTQRSLAEPKYLYIDDGSGVIDGTTTGSAGNIGIRIQSDPAEYAQGDYVFVTGISSCFKLGDDLKPCILPAAIEAL